MPALFLMAQVFFCPESQCWLMTKGRYSDAFESLKRLRRHPVQATRDLYCQSLFHFIIAQSVTHHQIFTSPHVTVFAYDWVCIVSADIVYSPRRLLMTAR